MSDVVSEMNPEDPKRWIRGQISKIEEDGFHVHERESEVEEYALLKRRNPELWRRLRREVRAHIKHETDLRVKAADRWADRVNQKAQAMGADATVSVSISLQSDDDATVSRALEGELVDDPRNLVYDERRLYQYDPDACLWQPVPDSRLSSKLQEFSGAPVYAGEQPKPLKVNRNKVNGAIDFLKARHDEHPPGDEGGGFFDEAPRGAMFANKFLRPDLDAGEIAFEDPCRAHRARHKFEFDFDPDARAPRFEQYLDEVFEGDDDAEDKQRVLMEFAGACLLGFAVQKQKAFVLYDNTAGRSGANGKTVFIKVLKGVFPDGTVSALPPQQFDHEFNAAQLAGKGLNVITEMPESDIVAGDAFKGIISGDPIMRSFKNQDAFTFSPKAGHLFACNTLPAVKDTSGAFWRRLAVIPFNNRFTGEDVEDGLEERLIQTEMQGIVAKFVRGARRLLARKSGEYDLPESSRKKHREWQRKTNPVEQFLIDEAENYDRESGYETLGPPKKEWADFRDLYEAYKDWSKYWGRRQMSQTKFGTRLSNFVEKATSSGYPKYDIELKPRHKRAAGRLTNEGVL